MSVSARPQSVNHRRYAWAANRITTEDMARLHALKQQTRIPITVMIAQAVSEFVKTRKG